MNGAVPFPLDLPDFSFLAAGDARVRRTILPSGVRVITERVPGARSATVGFWVPVGSRDEGDDGHGSTHFLEHLLFKGTASRSAMDIAVSFDSVGGEHNAMTAQEHTCYYAKVRDLDLPMAVEVLADMLSGSLIDPVEFENERGVILEELAMADDDPADVAGERLVQAVFGDHPLGRPIGGTERSIRAVTRDAVLEHYRSRYRPENLVVTVAGAVEHDRVVDALSGHLRKPGWTGIGTPTGRREAVPARVSRGRAVTVVERPLEQVNLMLGFPGLTVSDDRRAVMSVLNSILGGGMSSRLFQEVREKRGLAYSVHSFVSAYSDAGLFGLYAGCTPARAGEVAELMLAEFRAIAEDGITAEELARAVGQLGGASALALEDTDTRMSRLGRSELSLGEFIDLDETLARLARVGLDEVRDLAAELVSRPMSLAAVGSVDESEFRGLIAEPSAA